VYLWSFLAVGPGGQTPCRWPPAFALSCIGPTSPGRLGARCGHLFLPPRAGAGDPVPRALV